MKNVYDYRFKIKMSGYKNFVDTSLFYHLRYIDSEEARNNTYTIKTFDELVKKVENNFMNAEISKNFFGKTIVRISDSEHSCSIKVTEKNFKPIEILIEYRPLNLTFSKLANYLKADSFCEYLRDRGIKKIK